MAAEKKSFKPLCNLSGFKRQFSKQFPLASNKMHQRLYVPRPKKGDPQRRVRIKNSEIAKCNELYELMAELPEAQFNHNFKLLCDLLNVVKTNANHTDVNVQQSNVLSTNNAQPAKLTVNHQNTNKQQSSDTQSSNERLRRKT